MQAVGKVLMDGRCDELLAVVDARRDERIADDHHLSMLVQLMEDVAQPAAHQLAPHESLDAQHSEPFRVVVHVLAREARARRRLQQHADRLDHAHGAHHDAPAHGCLDTNGMALLTHS